MKARGIVWGLILVGVLTASVWWFSPWWVLHQVKAAAQRNDAQAVSDIIDYPRLRESLKGELNTALSSRLREGTSRLGEMGRTGATLGAVLAAALVEKLVDTMVRPEFVIQAVRDGQLALPGRTANERERAPSGGSAPGGSAPAEGSGADAPGRIGPVQFQWRPERVSADRMVVWVSKAASEPRPQAASRDEFGLVFERRGFVDWKLCAVRLPNASAAAR